MSSHDIASEIDMENTSFKNMSVHYGIISRVIQTGKSNSDKKVNLHNSLNSTGLLKFFVLFCLNSNKGKSSYVL